MEQRKLLQSETLILTRGPKCGRGFDVTKQFDRRILLELKHSRVENSLVELLSELFARQQ